MPRSSNVSLNGEHAAVSTALSFQEASRDKLYESRKYRLTGLTPILGSQPASEAIRTQFVSSKAPASDLSEEERKLFESESREERGLSVFARDPDNNDQLIVLDYMVRGFFKAALSALQSQLEIKSYKTKVDKYLFVHPRRIPLLRNGKAIYEEDSQYERPLRADTPKGPRVGLQASECVDTPWSIDVELRLIANDESAKSKPLSWIAVEKALDYGALSGLGQFRNGSYGTFAWERIE